MSQSNVEKTFELIENLQTILYLSPSNGTNGDRTRNLAYLTSMFFTRPNY